MMLWLKRCCLGGARPGTVTPVLVTSRAGGIAEGDIDLAPERQFPPVDLKTRMVGVQVQPPANDSLAPKGRLILVGNMEFATDRYLGGAPDNAAFALNAIDWLAQDEALISIRSRDRRPPRLIFPSQAMQDGVKYANIIFLPLLIAAVGMVRLLLRRRRALQPWTPLTRGPGAAACAPPCSSASPSC